MNSVLVIQYECVTCSAQLLLDVGGLFPISILLLNSGNQDPFTTFTRYMMQFLYHDDEYLALNVSLGTERSSVRGLIQNEMQVWDSE